MSSTATPPSTVVQLVQGEQSAINHKTCEHGHQGKVIVISADGTANKFGEKNTNVVEFNSRIVKNKKQIAFYISGIGTHNTSPVGRVFDMAFANSFEVNLLIAYKWLAENYEEGDRIFMFGFSRGAYQVRVIAGMIEQVGLIYPGNTTQLPDVFKLYMSMTERPNTKEYSDAVELCQTFKSAFSWPKVNVHFVGVWDTVSSVGFTRGACLPETVHGMGHVCHFRHALALDEKRVRFWPEYASGTKLSDPRESKPSGDIKEVWFAGSHSDVGGGNVVNRTLKTFGPALRWMTYEAMSCGLQMRPYTGQWKLPQPTRSLKAAWAILELFPLRRPSYNSEKFTRVPHLGSPRRIQDGQLIHESVFELMGIRESIVGARANDEVHRMERDPFPGGATEVSPSSRSVPFNSGGKRRQFMMIMTEIRTSTYEAILGGVRAVYSPKRSVNSRTQAVSDNNAATSYEPYGSLPHGKTWDDFGFLAARMEHDPFTNLDSTISRIGGATRDGNLMRLQSEVAVLATNISSRSSTTIGPLNEVPGALSTLLSAVKFLEDQAAGNSVILTLFESLALLPQDSHHRLPFSTFRNIAQKVDGAAKPRQLPRVSRHANGLLQNIHNSNKGNCIQTVAVTPATILSASLGGLEIWNQTENKQKYINIGNGVVVALFQANGSKLATVDIEGGVKIWDVKSGQMLRSLEGHSGTILCLAFSSQGSKLAAGSNDGTIQVWETETGRHLFPMGGHTSQIHGLAFSYDETCLASGSLEGAVQLWDGARKSKVLEGHGDWVRSVAFSKAHVISGSDDTTIRVWNAGSGDLERVLRGHTYYILCLAFNSPEFTLIASGSADLTARLWDVYSGEVLAVYDVEDEVWSIAFSPDGKQIVTGSRDGTIRTWNADVFL